jgi:hypothetical protein
MLRCLTSRLIDGGEVFSLTYRPHYASKEHIYFLRKPSYGILRRVDLVSTEVSEEPSASVIRVTRIGELGTTLAVTSNRRTFSIP